MTAPEPTHVYVFGFSDGVIKVGRSSNPVNRRRQHADAAKVRRATITNEWVLEHADAKTVERRLIQLARAHLEPLVGEYFSGSFRRFMKKVTKAFERCGFLPADRLTFQEVMDEFGVSKNDLLGARANGSLQQWPQINREQWQRNLFLRSEVDTWFSRYGLEERLYERAEAKQWRLDNRDGILEAAKRRALMRIIEEQEASA